MSTRLLRRIFLLVIFTLAIGIFSFLFLSSDYFKKWKYDKPLRNVLTRKDLQAVKLLVKQGAEVNTTVAISQSPTGTIFMTPIKMAVLRGDLDAARFFLQKGAHTNYVEPVYQRRNPFAYAVTFTGNFADDIPIWLAIQRRDEAMIKLLIEHNAKLNFDVWNGFTPYALLESSCNDQPTPKCRRILKC